MQSIIIGFSSSTKKFAPFGKAIQVWDNTNYSHVYFQFKNTKYNIDMIYQSSSTMLNYMSKDIFLSHNKIIKEFTLDLTDEQYSILEKKCLHCAGMEYGVLQIIGIVIADILGWDHNPFPESEKYICSEWVAEQLVVLGYKFNKELSLTKPIDVYKVLEHGIEK